MPDTAAPASPTRPHAPLAAHGLPARWRRPGRFVVLETAGGGDQAATLLALWQAWQDDPEGCDHLVCVSACGPLTAEVLRTAWPGWALAESLADAWPLDVPGWHTRAFAHPTQTGRHLTLQLGKGPLDELVPGLLAQVDAFLLALADPVDAVPPWWSRLDRLASTQASLSCAVATSGAPWPLARLDPWTAALRQGGFACQVDTGEAASPTLQARFQPRHTPRPQPGGLFSDRDIPAARRHAMVIGAGMAGAAAAWALTEQGWRVTLLERHAQPASEASGNPGGMFHAIVHAQEGLHARAHRHGALHTANLVSPWVREGTLRGSLQGLLRLEPRLDDSAAQALADTLRLPPEHLRWLSHAQAQAHAGLAVPSGGWLMGQAGWLSPTDLVRCLWQTAHATGLLQWVPDASVHQLARSPHAQWQALGALGERLACAPVVVLANANGLNPLLQTLPVEHAVATLPLSSIRGQVSQLAGGPSVCVPHLPVAGGGYVLGLGDGSVLCGATTRHHDPDPTVRPADHLHNLQQARRLGVLPPLADPACDPALGTLQGGRVGWRASTPDRLPLVGALPWSAERLAHMPRPPRQWQERLVPRERDADGGLFVLGGLGSRGLTWTALSARLLAHWVTGTPCPVPLDIRDALDPARFLCRQHRQP